MANVTITVDGKLKTVAAGGTTHQALATLASASSGVPRLSIPALNQKFSAGDNITLNGGEIIVSSLA
jgi:hypothetical protein